MVAAHMSQLDADQVPLANEILPAIMDYEQGWNASDADHMFRAAAEDVTQINIIGMFWVGRAALIKAHAALFGSVLKGVPLRFVRFEHLRPLGTDGLLTVIRWRVGGFSLPDTTKPEADNLMTMAFTKASGVWSLSHVANIEVVDALAAANPVP